MKQHQEFIDLSPERRVWAVRDNPETDRPARLTDRMNTTLDFFQYQASLYDAYQHACVPKYSEAVEVCAELLAHAMRDISSPRLLDVGCGTGNLSLKVLEVLTSAAVTCLDGSQNMLDEASRKLDGQNVTFHCLDLENDPWDAEWDSESYDAIYSAFVLEHLPFDAYRRFLSSARRILKPGGLLVAAEGFAGEPAMSVFFTNMREWEEKAVEGGVIDQATLDEMKRLGKENERHYFASKDDKKKWWNEIGFVDVDFQWQYYCLALLTGQKAGRSESGSAM